MKQQSAQLAGADSVSGRGSSGRKSEKICQLRSGQKLLSAEKETTNQAQQLERQQLVPDLKSEEEKSEEE